MLNKFCFFVSVQFADENNLRYYETSAKHPENLEQVKQVILKLRKLCTCVMYGQKLLMGCCMVSSSDI